jgi:hypothetical protein
MNNSGYEAQRYDSPSQLLREERGNTRNLTISIRKQLQCQFGTQHQQNEKTRSGTDWRQDQRGGWRQVEDGESSERHFLSLDAASNG